MRRFLLLVPLLLLAACSDSEDQNSKPAAPSSGYTAPAGAPTAPPAKPLTQADVDKFVEMQVAIAHAPHSTEGQMAVFKKFGVTSTQFGELFQRVHAPWIALSRSEKVNEAIPANLQADVELIKANRAKIEAAWKGKSVDEK